MEGVKRIDSLLVQLYARNARISPNGGNAPPLAGRSRSTRPFFRSLMPDVVIATSGNGNGESSPPQNLPASPSSLKRRATTYLTRLHAEEVQRVKNNPALRKALKRRPWWILDPRYSKFCPLWDFTTALALVFTAIVTPWEVAFTGQVSATRVKLGSGDKACLQARCSPVDRPDGRLTAPQTRTWARCGS